MFSMKTRSLSLLSFLAAMLGCNNDPSPYYVVAEVRTPVLQLLQKASDTNTNTSRKDCVSLDTDGEQGAAAPEVWCQQYPVRPDAPLVLKFVVVSPPGPDLAVSIEKVSRFTGFGAQLNSAGSARIGTSDNSNSSQEDLQAFEIKEISALRKTVLEEPLKVQEYYYSMKLPTANKLFQDFQSNGALPAFSLQYSVKSAQGEAVTYRADKGFVAFYVVPDPESRVFEAILGGLLGGGANPGSASGAENQPPALSEATIAQLREQAKSNTPPEILSFSPESEALPGNAETRLEIALGDDSDKGAKSRVLWFVSSGTLSNNKSKRPKWKPETSGKGTALVMVRDLQGGSDYKIKTFNLE